MTRSIHDINGVAFSDFETVTEKSAYRYTGKKDSAPIYAWGMKVHNGRKRFINKEPHKVAVLNRDNGVHFIVGIDIESLLNFCAHNKLSKVWFHNLSFDFDFIYKWLLKNHEIYKPRNITKWHDGYFPTENGRFRKNEHLQAKMNSEISIPLNENEWIMLKSDTNTIYFGKINYHGWNINFECTYLKLLNSIDNIGQKLGYIQKKSLDYDRYYVFPHVKHLLREKELMEYLEPDIDIQMTATVQADKAIRDIEIPAELVSPESHGTAIDNYIPHYDELGNLKSYSNLSGLKLTMASTAYSHLKEFIGRIRFDDYFKDKLNPEQHEFVSKSYFGGFTGHNPKFYNKDLKNIDGYSYDENSIYPYLMSQKVPYGTPIEATEKFINGKDTRPEYDIAFYRVWIRKATKMKPEYIDLLRVAKSRYGMPKYTGKIDIATPFYFAKVEWDFIKTKYKVDADVTDELWFRSDYIFKDWYEHLYHLKSNAPDPVTTLFYKFLFNAPTGKFGQKAKFAKQIILEWEKPAFKNQYLYGTEEKRFYKDSFTVKDIPINEVNFYYIPVIAYVTAQGRVKLWDAIFKNLPLVDYWDTDSMYLNGPAVGIEIDDKRIGAWKPEHRFNRFKVIRPKGYMFDSTHRFKNNEWQPYNETIIKISGMSLQGKKHLNWDNFKLGTTIKDGKKAKKSVYDGSFIVDVDVTLKETLY